MPLQFHQSPRKIGIKVALNLINLLSVIELATQQKSQGFTSSLTFPSSLPYLDNPFMSIN